MDVHIAKTLDDVVNFYNGPFFNNPRLPAAQFNFNQTQLNQLVAFMRGINVLQNIDVATRELREILKLRSVTGSEANTRLQTAFEDTQDGIRVLNQGGLYPTAVSQLTVALNRISQAQQSTDATQRRTLIQQAIGELDGARGTIATVTP